MNKYLIPIFLGMLALPAQAAVLSLSPNVIGSDAFQDIRIAIDTQGESVNAIEGSFKLPEDVEVKQVSDANSVVSLWVQQPEIKNNTISFSGLIPGGVDDKNGLLLTLRLKSGVGTYAIAGQDIRAYRNDGQGSQIPVEGELLLRVAEGVATAANDTDREPPDNFAPTISSDKDVYDGKYFLTFQTQDKGSGMDHYEVMEVPKPSWLNPELNGWEKVESPYLLKDQSRKSDILVKAVDKEGNFIVVRLNGQAAHSLWAYILLGLVLLCLIVFWYFFRRR